MANTILAKRSSVAGKIPATTSLSLGEFAINTNDGRVFIKKNLSATDYIVELLSTDSAMKPNVRAATTANITLSGTQVVDGVTLAVGDRVLVKNQSSAATNGIYLVASGAWTRTHDLDTAAKAAGAMVAVAEGTTNGGKTFDSDFKATDTLNTTSMAFNRMLDLGAVGVDVQAWDADLDAIAALAGTSGFLKKTGTNTWTLDTSTYLTANQSITLSGDISGTGATAITTAIGANKVTNAMLAQVATGSILGRVTAATGNVETLTGTQATTLLDTFTSTLKGLVPASGGGTANFLRADGTWAAPGAASGVSSISFGTTGLTPNSATTGAVTVAGTLAIANGGTGATSASTAATALGLGTASDVQFNSLGIGVAAAPTAASVTIAKNATGGTNYYGINHYGVVQSDVTNIFDVYRSYAQADAAATTLSFMRHFRAEQNAFPVGFTLANQYGFSAHSSLIGATNNYGFHAADASAITTGKTWYGFYSSAAAATGGGTAYGFYAAGTAPNVFNNLAITTVSGILKGNGASAITAAVAGTDYVAPGGVGTTPTGSIVAYAGITAPTGWLLCAGQSVSRTTYAALFAALSSNATVTMTIATPGVVTWTGHTLVNGNPVTFNTTGALPTGITAGTTYYVVNAAANTFQIAATVGGAAIATSGTQSGTHTCYYVPYGTVAGGTTVFNLPDLRGRIPAGQDNMNGTAANRLTTAGSGINGVLLGTAGGAETHTLTTAQLSSHTHAVAAASGTIALGGATAGPGNVNTNSGSQGSGSAHNNTQPTIVMNYIIKT